MNKFAKRHYEVIALAIEEARRCDVVTPQFRYAVTLLNSSEFTSSRQGMTQREGRLSQRLIRDVLMNCH
jgi:hypothetical protein